MSTLPELPVVQANLFQARHRFSLSGTAGWQLFPVPLRPMEEVQIQLSGKIVYHYREWTTSGSCGKKKQHVERHECGPDSDVGKGVFGAADADTAEPFSRFEKFCQPELTIEVTEEHTAGRREGRLAGVIFDCLNGNGGDNQGSYQLDVAVEWAKRAERLIQELSDITAGGGQPALPGTPNEVARRILRWETPRILLDSERQRRFCTGLTELGKTILAHAATQIVVATKEVSDAGRPWVELAVWLGNWAVTETAGGRMSHADGWILQGDAAARLGQLTVAHAMFVKALDFAEPGPLLYRLGKLQEMKGVFFSPQREEVTTVESARVALASAEKAALVGAVELYSLSLSEGNSKGAVADDKATFKIDTAGLRLRQLQSYDIHYALGRLNFLRHTTTALRASADHFRQCRRLARYRLLTHPSLFSGYTLAALLDDARRIHPNPFNTGGRVASVDYPAVVALRDVPIEVSVEATLPDTTKPVETTVAISQDLHEDPFQSSVRWMAIAGTAYPSDSQDSVAALPGLRQHLQAFDFRKVQDYMLTAQKLAGKAPEQVFPDTDFEEPFLKIGDALSASLLAPVAPMKDDITRTQVAPVTAWLQNPMYWLDFVLRFGTFRIGQAAPFANADWRQKSLVKAPSESADTLTFEFGDKIFVDARLTNSRPQVTAIRYRDANDAEYSVVLDTEPLPHPGRRTTNDGEVAGDEVRLVKIVVHDKALPAPGTQEVFEVRFFYHLDCPSLLQVVEIHDWRARTTPYAAVPEFGRILWKWRLKFEYNQSNLEYQRPTLASAYVPFHRSAKPEAYRRVTAADLRWVLAQRHMRTAGQPGAAQKERPDVPEDVALAVVCELGRRSVERLAPDADPEPVAAAALSAAAVLFDVIAGQFPSLSTSAQAAACSALMAGEALSRWPQFGAYSERARSGAIRFLAEADLATITQLCTFPVPLAPITLPPLLPLESSADPLPADEQDAVAAEEHARQPARRFTRAWIEAFTRAAAEGNKPLAWWLARPIIANGLADLAHAWLVAWNINPLAAHDIFDWLAARALPAQPPEDEKAMPHQRTFHYPALFAALTRQAYRAWPREPGTDKPMGDTAAVPVGEDPELFAAKARAEILEASAEGLREEFREIYTALGYTPDSLWTNLEGARREILLCAEEVLRRLNQEYIYRGREALAEALPGLVTFLISLDAPGNSRVTSGDSQRIALRVASLTGPLIRALIPLPFDTDQNRAKTWSDEIVAKLRNADLLLRIGLTEIVTPEDKDRLVAARKAIQDPTTFGPAVIALAAAGQELKPLPSNSKIEKIADAEKKNAAAEKKKAEADATKGIVPLRKDEDAGQISVVEMNAANYNTWELVLNDEPYSDCAAALLALADRHLSRQETAAAEKPLREALGMLMQLETDESDHISPEDRWQVGPMLRRVQLRIAWLAQGRDAYGRFATQAPPRRLGALLGQFKRHLDRYDRFLKEVREQIDRSDRARRTVLLLDLQRNEANHAARRAERQVEKCRRLIANTQARISSHEMRLNELTSEMVRGETQYRNGKVRSDKAVGDLGKLALSVASSYLPVPAPAAALGLNDAQDLIKAVKTVSDIADGRPPLQVIAAAYGQDVLDVAFASFDAGQFLSGQLQKSVGDAVKQYATEGRINLGGLAGRTMERVGEDLFRSNCARLADYFEKEIPQTEFFRSARKQWDDAKKKIEDNLGKPFAGVQELRQFVNQARVKVDERVKVLREVLNAAANDATDRMKELRDEVLAGELPPRQIVPALRKLVEQKAGDVKESWKDARAQAEKSLQDLGAVIAKPETWWKLCGFDKADVRTVPAALRAACGHFAEMVDAFSDLSLDAEAQNFLQPLAMNLRASVALSAQFVRQLPLPLDRVLLDLSAHAQKEIRDLARKVLDEVTDAGVNRALLLRDALGGELEVIAGENPNVAEAAEFLRRALPLAATFCRTAQVELSSYPIPPDIAEKLRQDLDEALKTMQDFAKKELKAAWHRLLGRKLPSLSTMLERAVQRGETTLRKVYGGLDNAISEAAAGTKAKSLVDLLLGANKDATRHILCYLEDEPSCPVPLTNGVLEMVLNTGLKAVQDPRIKDPKAELPPPKFVLAAVSLNNAGVKLEAGRDALEEPEKVVAEQTASALMPLLFPKKDIPEITQEDVKQAGEGLTKDDGGKPIEPQPDLSHDIHNAGTDELSNLLGNPGVQAMVAAISMSIPAVGIAVQAIGFVNNWLCGATEQNAGAQRVGKAMTEARQVDQAVMDARHQRELAELELLAAQDDLDAAHAQRQGIERIGRLDSGAEDRDVYLQRMVFRQMSANLELLGYTLYVLQKAFEYEFDAKLDEIFSRWPSLQRFRALLELSPGVLAGEFDRTNIHRDLLEQTAQLSNLPDVVQLVRDLALGTRYRDRFTFSMAHDFPAAWDRFHRGEAPLLFETTLLRFSGIAPSGRPLRHSIKIRSLRLEGQLRDPGPKSAPAKEEPKFQFISPKALGIALELQRGARSGDEARLIRRCPERLKWAVFHAGEGWQIDESGALRWIEWGPQVADSNHDSEEAENYYNALEGLTPATRWIIDYDRTNGLLPLDFEDILVTVEFTYGLIEENVRHAFAFAQHEQISGSPVLSGVINDTPEVSTLARRTDARAAQTWVRRRVGAAQAQP